MVGLTVIIAMHACRYYIATLEGLEHSWLTYVGNRALRSSLSQMSRSAYTLRNSYTIARSVWQVIGHLQLQYNSFMQLHSTSCTGRRTLLNPPAALARAWL